MIDTYQYIGNGVYSIGEASRYVGLNPQRLRYWYFGRKEKSLQKPIIPPTYDPIDNKYSISFLDLIDAYIVAFLLKQGVKRKTIRSAYLAMENDLNRKHPFCHARILTDGKKIFSESADELGDSRLYEVVNNQIYYNEFRHTLDALDYDPNNNVVIQWNIYDRIIINPEISFGKPTVKNTGTTTYVVARAYEANDNDVELVADLYQIKKQDVLNAVAFENQLSNKKAA